MHSNYYCYADYVMQILFHCFNLQTFFLRHWTWLVSMNFELGILFEAPLNFEPHRRRGKRESVVRVCVVEAVHGFFLGPESSLRLHRLRTNQDFRLLERKCRAGHFQGLLGPRLCCGAWSGHLPSPTDTSKRGNWAYILDLRVTVFTTLGVIFLTLGEVGGRIELTLKTRV